MNLHEYQAKNLLNIYGLSIPTGYVCTTPYEAEKAASKIGSGPWVIKCQVHAGGRSKAGGIKIVNNKKKVRDFAEYWLGKRIVTYQTDHNGKPVNLILVETMIDIRKELYLGVTIDRISQKLVFMASSKGGIEVENIVKDTPNIIHKIFIDPLLGPMPYQGRELMFKLKLDSKILNQFINIFMVLTNILLKYDLISIEINPLVINHNGDLICLDSKMILDSNALFRQPNLHELYDETQENPREYQATKLNFNYVEMHGNIGCIANGAGLAMYTIDTIKLYGGTPANFLDIGGKITKENIIEAFKIILLNHNVKTILVNIFGGIVRCDLIANGIILAIKNINIIIPIIVRLEGNHAEIGIMKLNSSNLANIFIAKDTKDAIQKAISVSYKRNK